MKRIAMAITAPTTTGAMAILPLMAPTVRVRLDFRDMTLATRRRGNPRSSVPLFG